MTNAFLKITIFLAANLLACNLYAFQPWGLEGFAVAEDVTNFSGGQQSGAVFNGVYHPIVRYSVDDPIYNPVLKAGLLAITYTRNQFNYSYASQSVSNMSAQREIRVAELNIDFQPSSWTRLKIGLMDIRDDLNIYDVPKELINSGFGTNRVMAGATNVATYPYPGFGAILQLNSKPYNLSLALFQGDPQHQDTVFQHGFFSLQELTYQSKLDIYQNLNVMFNLGFWQFYQPDPTIGYSNIGSYLMGQTYWYYNKVLFNIFGELGYGPNDSNSLPYSACIGANTTGIIRVRPKDKIAIGISQIWLRNLKNERVYEITYAMFLMQNLYLKADLQYILNPSGIKPNAFAGIARIIYNIDGHLLARH